MDAGGVAMTRVGEYGPNVRGDARVTVADAEALSFEVRSSVEALYGKALREQVRSALARAGDPTVRVEVEDSGALPFVLEARLEAALCRHLGLPLATLPRIERSPRKDRLRRSRLYVPGNNAKLLHNAGLYGADSIILDLEDSVTSDAKFDARVLVRHALATLRFGDAEVIVRVNSGGLGHEDLEAVATLGVDAILVPKAESADQIREIAGVLDRLDAGALLIPLLESAKGMIAAYEIACASERVAAIAIGMEDYVTDIHAERTQEGIESAWAQGQVVNAARAAGVPPLASVYPRFDDDERVADYARTARSRGFDGVGCIHPRQIKPVHRAFAPSEAERLSSLAIVAAYEEAVTDGRGATSVEGRMVDLPVYQRAKETLARAE